MIQYWVLTFNRPRSVNRVIESLHKQGVKPNIYSNSPWLHIDYPSSIGHTVINHMGTNESTSWCARSWNSIYIKALEHGDKIVCLQDDTDVGPNFVNWIEEQSKQYHFMFGPAGDQFHYITKEVIQAVGWWDERYNGCYCADADYLRRVMFYYKPDHISVEETHGWGFYHNPCGISQNVIARTPHNVVDTDYKNQHTALEEIADIPLKDHLTTNFVVQQARENYKRKWGVELSDRKSCAQEGYLPQTTEIDWYPWATNKYGIKFYKDFM